MCCETSECWARLYRAASNAFLRPAEGEEAARAGELCAAHQAAQCLGLGPLGDAAERLCHAQGPMTAAALAKEHDRAFGHTVSKEHPPYETSWGSSLVFQQTAVLADITGFYEAFGVHAADARRERPDHLATELEFVALLAWKEARAREAGNAEGAEVCADARRRFVAEHLAPWAPFFARLVARRFEGPIGEGAKYLDALLDADLAALGVDRGAIPELAPAASTFEAEGGCFACGGGMAALSEETGVAGGAP